MGDINYAELFGIDEGANGQETAEPAEENTESTEGANEQETAEPAAEEDNSTDTEDQGEKDPEKQTKEQNAKYAAARRKAEAERDAAVSKAKADAARYIDEQIKAMGLTNPYTKTPITNKAELDAYRVKYDSEKREQILQKTGMTDDEFKAYVNDLPEVKQARQAAADLQAQQAQLRIDGQLKEIQVFDPNIKTLEDLVKEKNYEEVYGYVKRGMTLSEAYRLANFDKISGRAAAAAKQSAMSLAAGKEHLTATSGRGKGAASVPADVKEMYIAFNPGATDAEIAAHWNRYHNDE